MLELPLLPDRIERGVRVLLVGINPGVRSALTGHHFAGLSNRFWKLLYESGLVTERLGYEDDVRLHEWGFGITNIIARPTASMDALTRDEFAAGRLRLRRKVQRCRPAVVALVGVTVFRAMFPGHKGQVMLGLQRERLGRSEVFVLPNPSGRNAHFSYAQMLAAYRELRVRLVDVGVDPAARGGRFRSTRAPRTAHQSGAGTTPPASRRSGRRP